ncbi:hypothetical protein FOYG_09430 [Fusarium oxysporum NRRL 32931]|uniref:Uncharacterized protein n=1 Tax=Fusarium oxysporum NRRL 32931 TaxID=660029 RepID=W9I0E5_FUSOX|nr:hypothetical protein FOYG_09430 [Fusarium oxysporum NRRL 32931]
MESFLLRLPGRAMANALEREDLKNITLLNSALRKKYGGEYFQTVRVRGSQSQVADRLGKFLDQEQHPGTFVPKSKIKFLEIHIVAARVLDPRTARDHQGNFEDARCFERIAQALKEIVELVGISIEFSAPRGHQIRLTQLTQLLKQDLVQTNLRDVRLINTSGGVDARKELFLTLMKMCGHSQARCVDFDHYPGLCSFLYSLSP